MSVARGTAKLGALCLLASLIEIPLAQAPARAATAAWSTQGPSSGFIVRQGYPNPVLIHPTNPDVAYTIATGISGGVFKTVSGGRRWALASDGIRRDTGSAAVVHALVMDPSDPETLYAGTFRAGVFKTVDGGESWEAASAGIPVDVWFDIRSLAVDPARPGTVYAGTNGSGVYKTTDGAATWTSASAGLPRDPGVPGLAVAPSRTDTLYAGVYSNDGGARVFRSTDGGANWVPASSGITSSYTVFALAVDPSDPLTVYAAPNGGTSHLFKTADGGDTWTLSQSGLGDPLQSLAIHPSAPGTIFGAASSGNGQIYKTADGAASWIRSDAGFPSTGWAEGVAIAPSDPSIIYAATVNGVFRSPDAGVTWESRNNGFPSDTIIDVVAVAPTDPDRIYAGTANIAGFSNYYSMFVSTDGARSWAPDGNGLPRSAGVWSLVVDPTDSETAFAGSGYAGVYKTVDGGATWVSAGLEPNVAYALAIDPADRQIVYAGTQGTLYKSTDGGATWAQTGFNPGSATLVTVRAIAIDPTDSRTIYIAADPFEGGTVFKSTDGGATWVPMNAGIVSAPTVVKSLVIDPTDPQTVYAGAARYFDASGGVFKTTNGGLTWSRLNELDVEDMAIDPRDPEHLFAGTYEGDVMASSDGGSTWETLGDGLPGRTIRSLSIDARGMRIFAATEARGVFDLTLRAPGSVDILDGDGYLGAFEAPAGIPVRWSGSSEFPGVSATIWLEDRFGDTPPSCRLTALALSGSATFPSSCAAALPEGPFTAKARWTDASGQISIAVDDPSVKDTRAPKAPAIVAPGEGTTIEKTTIALSGFAEPAATVRILEGSDASATAVADSAGAWSATGVFAEGAHTISATATDAAGNESAPAARSFAVNLAPHIYPIAKNLSPSLGSVLLGAPEVTVSWDEVSGGDSVVGYQLNVGRPGDFTQIYSRRIEPSECASGRCSVVLAFPLDTPAPGWAGPLPAAGKYAAGVVTLFENGARSDGLCDDGSAFGAICGGPVPPVTDPPGYTYTEFLVTSRSWPSAYQDAKSRDTFLLDPATAEFQLWRWNERAKANLYDDAHGFGVLLMGSAYTYAEAGWVVAMAVDEAQAQGVFVTTTVPPRATGFVGRRL